SVTDLTEALGPEGANADGALDRFVSSSADNLAGNGAALGRSIDELSEAATTLADSSQDISETVVNLQSFVTCSGRTTRRCASSTPRWRTSTRPSRASGRTSRAPCPSSATRSPTWPG